MVSVLGDVEAMGRLGSRIRAQRLRRNLSQEHVAKLAGVSVPTYRKIEAGNGSIEFRYVAKVLALLGFANALGDLIPEIAAEVDIKDLIAPERLRASKSRKR